MRRPVTLFVSIDTEEDNWRPARDDVTVENIRRLPELDSFFAGFGVRPTYFVTYQVAGVPWAADVLREIRDRGRSEIGAHLHPWNTPPLSEPMEPRFTMTRNLSYELQAAKLEALTEVLHAAFGAAPVSFRTGRFGLGPETVRALLHCGYRVDASITPTMNWRTTDDGPDFERAPIASYVIGVVETADSEQRLIEVPNSFGYSRRPFHLWNRVYRTLSNHGSGPAWPVGLASRLGIVRKIVLNPELSSARDMLVLSRTLIEEGIPHLQLYLHSPTFLPGATPYTQTGEAVTRMFASLAAYFEGLLERFDVRFANMADAEAVFGPLAARQTPAPGRLW